MSRRLACACCFIVPPGLLADLRDGTRLRPQAPELFAQTLAETERLGAGRPNDGKASVLPPHTTIPDAELQASSTHLFDCGNQPALPGTPLASLDAGGTGAAAVAAASADVRRFYGEILGRDSIDNRGMPIISSLNYGANFANAFWSGQVMVYGNGDRNVFGDFWQAPDVICHEITHGITQHESGLVYAGESGAVNESISDCFAAVFQQWLAKLPASDPAGWRLGAKILGPQAIAAGYTCLRDMATPTAPHCLSRQQSVYPNRDMAGDVHVNSGIPNRAFADFARGIGGNAYDAPIKVWYAACTAQGLRADATIADFASATVRAATAWPGPERAALVAGVQAGWTAAQVAIAA